MVDLRQATPDYVKVMRLTLLQGRWLASPDIRGAERVVVLNEVAARRYLGSEQAVGANVTFQAKTWKVVGVVKGLRLAGPESEVRPEAYVPVAQSQIVGGQVVVRAVDPTSIPLAALRDAVRALSPQAAPEVEVLDDLFSGLIAARRFNMSLLSMFGLLAVVIAAIGVYGAMAFLVATPYAGDRGSDGPGRRCASSASIRALAGSGVPAGRIGARIRRRVQPRRSDPSVPLSSAALRHQCLRGNGHGARDCRPRRRVDPRPSGLAGRSARYAASRVASALACRRRIPDTNRRGRKSLP
jgi:putative ABC transport system permease protein